MYLLTTDRAELRRWSKIPKTYAILSHVWQKQPREQVFDDIKEIVRKCRSTHEHPSKYVSAKIWSCCRWAKSNGFKRIWIDTCCIDKASSADLSEAINSMFNWYTRATICYAYLHDVPGDDDPFAPNSAFRNSAWFKRGWTLQELVAPKDVVFLSREWTPLTAKRAAPELIAEITRISRDVLMGVVKLWDVTVAERMSWAADRRTTRVEDQAYCLMGMFNVHMPPIYGEGEGAFIRLQEAIIRSTPDHTLFAWGYSRNLPETVLQHRPSLYPTPYRPEYIQQSCLLANSPSAFKNAASDIQLVPLDKFAQELQVEPRTPTFQPTSYGILSHLPLVRFYNKCTVLLLPCKVKGDQGDYLGLLLREQGEGRARCLGTCVVLGQTEKSPSCRHFDNHGLQLRGCNHTTIVRYVLLPKDWANLPYLGNDKPQWEYVTLAHRLTHVEVRAPGETGTMSLPTPWTTKLPPSFLSRQSRIFVPEWIVHKLETKGFHTPDKPSTGLGIIRQLRGGDACVLTFSSYDRGVQFSLHFNAIRSANGRIRCTPRFSSAIGLFHHTRTSDRGQPQARSSSVKHPKQEPQLARPTPGTTADASHNVHGGWGFIDDWTEARTFVDEAGAMKAQVRFQRLGEIHSGHAPVQDRQLYLVDISLDS